MEIAYEPAEAGALGGGGESYLEDRLRLLGDEVSGAGGVEKGDAIVERLGQVEAEFAAIFGRGAPAALCEGVAVHGKEDFEDCGGGGREGGADDFHGKYRVQV
jgi:hypothetical protein